MKIAKDYQTGRVSENLTNVSFDFTEGWFRNSGLYDLNKENQLKFMKWFCEEQKCKVADCSRLLNNINFRAAKLKVEEGKGRRRQ